MKIWTNLWHWISLLVKLIVPEVNPVFWPVIPFRPFLYPATFIGAMVVFISDQGIPMEFRDHYNVSQVPTLWLCLAIPAPLLAFLALHLIAHGKGKARLYGYWLRLCADILQFTGMGLYDLMRFSLGGSAVLLTYVTMAATLFMVALVCRDITFIARNEGLATRIQTQRRRDDQRRRRTR